MRQAVYFCRQLCGRLCVRVCLWECGLETEMGKWPNGKMAKWPNGFMRSATRTERDPTSASGYTCTAGKYSVVEGFWHYADCGLQATPPHPKKKTNKLTIWRGIWAMGFNRTILNRQSATGRLPLAASRFQPTYCLCAVCQFDVRWVSTPFSEWMLYL